MFCVHTRNNVMHFIDFTFHYWQVSLELYYIILNLLESCIHLYLFFDDNEKMRNDATYRSGNGYNESNQCNVDVHPILLRI